MAHIRWAGLIGALVGALALACAPATPGAGTTAPEGAGRAPASAGAAGPSAASTGPAASPGGEQPATLTRLRIAAVNPLALYWDLYAANELGYFHEQGIDLEILYTTSPTRSAQVVVSGDAELGTVGADTVIESITKGADLRIVAGGGRQPNFTLMAQPTVQQYGDLRGKLLAVAGPALADAVFLKKLLATHGLQPSDYDLISIGGTAERYAALKSGAIAATLLTQPVDFQAQDDGLRRLGTSYEVVQDYQFVTTTVRRDWAEQNGPLLVRFIKAIRTADRWLYESQNEGRAVEILVQNTNTREDYARRSYDLYYREVRSMPEDASISIPGLANVIQIMAEQGRLEPPLPGVDRFIDTRYWSAAAQ